MLPSPASANRSSSSGNDLFTAEQLFEGGAHWRHLLIGQPRNLRSLDGSAASLSLPNRWWKLVGLRFCLEASAAIGIDLGQRLWAFWVSREIQRHRHRRCWRRRHVRARDVEPAR